MSEHLDLDALADVLAGERSAEHLSDCEACRGKLSQLERAMPSVSTSLRALPLPPEPAGLAARLDRALTAERSPGGADVVPLEGRRRTRWLPALGAVAALALAVGGAAVVLQQDDGSGQDGGGYALSSTGTDYSRDAQTLRAALPSLLEGTAPDAPEAAVLQAPQDAATAPPEATSPSLRAAADPLASLRTDEGLASCLLALGDPADPQVGLPLALDYASFEGQPALVVVLPTTRPDKVDVFVVAAGCAQADAKLLFFTRLTRP